MKFCKYFSLVLATFTCIQVNAQYKKQSSADALADLLELKTVLTKYHPNPFRYISSNDWNSAYNSINSQLKKTDSIDQISLIRLFTPLINSIKDEHFGMYLDDSSWANMYYTENFFPLKLTYSKKEDYLIVKEAIDSKYNSLIGENIIVINGYSANELIELGKANWVPSSSTKDQGTLYHLFNHDNFSRFFKLYVDTAQTFNLTLSDNSTLQVQGTKLENEGVLPSINKTNKELAPEMIIDKTRSYAYLKISSFMPPAYGLELKEAQKKLQDFFQQLRDENIIKLTIDIRGNRGGTPYYSAYLSSFFHENPFYFFNEIYCTQNTLVDLKEHVKGYGKLNSDSSDSLVYLKGLKSNFQYKKTNKALFKGTTSILVDSGVGSAASMFAAHMKSNKLATIHGTETLGDCYATSGAEWYNVELKHSKIMLYIPLFMFVHGSIIKENHGIIPDSTFIPAILLPVPN